MKENLQAGVEFTLAIFPQPPTLFQPSKRVLNDPSLWQYNKGHWDPEKFACKLAWKVADLILNECF